MADAAVADPDTLPDISPALAAQADAHPVTVHTTPKAAPAPANDVAWDGKTDPFAALPPTPAAAPPTAWDGKSDPFEKINQEEAAKPPPKLATPSSIGGQIGSGLSQAAITAVGWPFDIAAGVENMGIRGVNALTGSDLPMAEGGSQRIGELFGKVDPRMDPANAPEPTNEAERIARGVGTGVGAAVMPGAVVGLAGKTGVLSGQALQTAERVAGTPSVGAAVTGAAAGAGAQVASDAAPDAYKPVAGVAGALIGGGLASGLAGAIAPSAVAGASRADLVQAAQRLTDSGSPVTIPAAAASDRMAVQRTGQILANVPVAGDPLVQAGRKSVGQLGRAADDLAESTGGASKEEAGAAASKGIQDWVGPVSSARVKDAYDTVDRLVNPNIPTDLSETRKVAQQIATQRQGSALTVPGNAVSQVMDGLTRPGGLTYGGIKGLRTNIGEMLKQGQLPADTSQGELKRIYGALSSDLQTAVENAGGKSASAAFNRANNLNKAVAERREQVLKLLGGNSAPRSDEAVFSAIQRAASTGSGADATLLSQARRVMKPEDWQEVASGVIGTLGRDAEGNFSPDRFLTSYGKLSEAGKNTLFSVPGGSQIRQSLDDIATISSRFKQLKQFSNPSGTGHTLAGFEIAKAAWAEPMAILPSMIGGRVLASALAKPATASATANWAQKYLNFVKAPSAATIAQMRGASTRVAATFGAHLGAQIDPEALVRFATGGPQPAAAKDTENQ